MSASHLTAPNLPFIHGDIKVSMIVQCGGARSPFSLQCASFNTKYNVVEKCYIK